MCHTADRVSKASQNDNVFSLAQGGQRERPPERRRMPSFWGWCGVVPFKDERELTVSMGLERLRARLDERQRRWEARRFIAAMRLTLKSFVHVRSVARALI